MSEIKIGDPYRLGNVYGRVVGFDGGLLHFSTPYGTVITIGWARFVMDAVRLTEWEDLDTLFKFDQMAIDAGQKLYGGRLAETEVA